MTFSPILTRKPAIARVLLLIFAFCAWSLTAPANIALALLAALFLTEVPGHWRQLRREPALLLLVGVLAVTSALALRAAWLFPDTAADQWRAISAWVTPLLFIIPAWWLRRDPDQVWPLLGAAFLGLVFGVLHKTDWSLTQLVLAGMRYHFGYAALGLAFIASVMLVGLSLFRARITGMRIGGRARPLLGWALWGLGLAFLLVVLVVTQSRGAAVGLAVVGVSYALLRWRNPGRQDGRAPWQARLALVSSALLFVALAGTLLWSTRDRQLADLRELTLGSQGELSYNEAASVAIRLNLAQVGLQAFRARPLLGFGPGTSTTEFLIPKRILAVSDYQRAHAPAASHLHSAAIETLARFGLVGALIAAALLAVLGRAYRTLWSDPRAAPDLRAFLTLGAVMLLLYCLYDFRLMNLDLRFFFILFLGILYSFQLRPGGAGPRSGGS